MFSTFGTQFNSIVLYTYTAPQWDKHILPGLRFKVAFKQKACSPRNINFIGIFILFLRLQNLESESFADSCYQHFFKNRNFRYYSWNLLVPFIQFFGLIAPGNTGRYLTHLFELFVQHLVILHLLPSFWMLLSPGIATSITTALFCSKLPPLYPVG